MSRKKTGEIFYDHDLGKDFLNMIPKSQFIREKLLNWTLSKLKITLQNTLRG